MSLDFLAFWALFQPSCDCRITWVIFKPVRPICDDSLVKPKGKQGHRRALTQKEREAVISAGKTDRRFYELFKDIPHEEHLAIFHSGEKIKDENRWRLWRRFKVIAGLNTSSEDLTPYCLRHEYCTMYARKGVDIRVAQRLMGHSSIELTANIYTHVETLDLLKGYHIW